MRFVVTADDTAISLGSGDVPVLATPRMIAWMEAATVEAAAPFLEPGQTTVGTAIRIKHRRPTAVGDHVDITADASRTDRGLTFTVRAIDGAGEVVGTGEVDRAIVDRDQFVASLPSATA